MDDTETLIALVSSLLTQHDEAISQSDIIEALIYTDGNVEDAAQLLQSNKPSKSKKRKRIDLNTWLKPPPKKKQDAKNTLPCGASDPRTTRVHSMKPLSSSSSSMNTVDLMSVLRQPPSPKKGPLRLPPVTLTTPKLVLENSPCTLHLSVLPPELACKLFYSMIDASREWKRNKWWLYDRVVESPHHTSFFARRTDGLDNDESWQEAAQYWYNGRLTDPPSSFPPEMEEACQIVEKVVNDEMRKRTRFRLEYGGGGRGDPLWRANVAASNRYQGSKESVGFHSDQLTYLGPYPTIASLSLGTRRNFSLREVIPTEHNGVRKAQTLNIPLPHNSLIIMHASCQERFKHSIPPQSPIDLFRPAFPRTPESAVEPSNCRINITFRFYRPDFRPPTIPKCHCNVPMILRPDMKNRNDEETDRYWWACYAGAQNEGKGCNFWKVMEMQEEGRGPCITSDKRTVDSEGERETLS